MFFLAMLASPSTTFISHNTGVKSQIEDLVIDPSSETDVFIIEEAIYDAPIAHERPVVHLSGVIYWERLAGSLLNFFLNASDVITHDFWDYDTNENYYITDIDTDTSCLVNYGTLDQITNCVTQLDDRYIIIPDSRSFVYEISAYYDPDIIQDTGFIVIFNSQSVDFPLSVDGELVYAKVDYKNVIVLPIGAGVVSFAPIDEGFFGLERLTVEGGIRWQLTWEYKHRELDSKHDPLIIEVTYSYGPIYLKFTEQVYQLQKDREQQQEEQNRLDLINTSFTVIATLALLAALFSVLMAYLIARRKFQADLERAQALPRRAVSDIETSNSLKIPTRSLLLSAMLFLPMFFAPIPIDAQSNDQIISWTGEYDLKRDLTLKETVTIVLPILKDFVYVYTNTSEVFEFSARDEFGNEITFEEDPGGHRYKLYNPGFAFTYEIDRPYKVYNNSGMLVLLDRFWMEFRKPPEIATLEDQFFHVDLKYTVFLPSKAILYSASPTETMEPGTTLIATVGTTDGRWNITWTDYDRQMDAFHDVFESQITFSYLNILEALENLNTPFQVANPEEQDITDLIQIAGSEILLFSLLGLIAPLLSFLIAYWVFRKRYQKRIERIEDQQEQEIFVESAQIEALVQATSKEAKNMIYQSFKGHYWRLVNALSAKLHRDSTLMEFEVLTRELQDRKIKIDEITLNQLIIQGKSADLDMNITYDELFEYASQVDVILALL